MFVITLTYTAPADQIDATRPRHREWLDPHVASGLFLATGPMLPKIGGVLIASGKVSRDELMEILKSDPFQVEGVADYIVTEFEPNKLNPALVGLV